MKEGDNKALGFEYLAKEDNLHIKTFINFSRRNKKMRVGQDLQLDQIRAKTPCPLTRRELLSQVASLYDPVGHVTPLKQKGAILVRKAFQQAGGGSHAHETWNTPLLAGLKKEALDCLKSLCS